MKRFYPTALIVALAVSAALQAAPAAAQQAPEPGARFAGRYILNATTGAATFVPAPAGAQLAGDVYNNTNPAAPANFGYSLTDLAAIFGDRVTTTGPGLLDQDDFTVYNSSSSTGTLLTATFSINLYNGPTSAFLGGYVTGTVAFGGGAGLPPGYYSIVTINNIAPLGINLPTTDVIITQQVATYTGTPSRLGIVSMDPPSIGSSGPSMYLNSVAVGPAGFYNIGTYNANPGYRINVTNATPTNSTTWGKLKTLYR